MRRLLVFSFVIALAGCGRKEVVVPAPRIVEGESRCPATMWRPGELRPANVHVLNQSGDSISVWLDRCVGHTHMVDMAGRDSLMVALPNGAASYDGKLRFIVFRGSRKAITVEFASPTGDPDIRLEVPESSEECPHFYVDGKRTSGPPDVPRDQIVSVEYVTMSNGDCAQVHVKLRQ